MKKTIATMIASLTFCSAPALAACNLSYKTFEFAVTHLDLEECPASMKQTGAFCRATIGADAVHVFAFAEGSDQCLLTVRSYEKGSFELQLK